MRISLRSMVVWKGLALAIVVAASSLANAADGPEKTLPPYTFAHLKIDNVSKLRQGFNGSQIGQLLADPAMQPLLDEFLAKFEESTKEFKEEMGISIKELLLLPQGAVSIALVPKEGGNVPFAVLASADAGSNEPKVSEVLDKANRFAEKKGGKITSETFKDFKLTIIRENEEDKDPVIWTKKGNVFYFGSEAEIFKDYLSSLPGRGENLAADDNHINTMKVVAKDSQVTLFVDVSKILNLLNTAIKDGNAAQRVTQLQLLGVNGLKAIGVGFGFDVGEYDQLLKLFVYSPGPAQGLFKIFAMPPTDLKPQAWVPASVFKYQAISWNFDAAWDAINDLVGQSFPGVIDQVEKQLGGNGEFSFKKDLFGPLGKRITLVSDFKKPITEKSQGYLFALALDDQKTFQNTFNKLLDVAHASPKKREFQGQTIYDFELTNLPANANLNIDGPISVAIAKDHLFASTDPSYLEQALRSGGQGLAESPDYVTVSKKAPEKTSFFSFERAEEQAKVLYEMVKSGKFAEMMKQNLKKANPNAPDVDFAFDPKKLPDFSVIAKYMSQSGSYGVMEEQGVTGVQFVLKKAAP